MDFSRQNVHVYTVLKFHTLVLPIGAAGRDNLANLVRWKVDIFILRGTFAQTMRKVMGHSAPCDPT